MQELNKPLRKLAEALKNIFLKENKWLQERSSALLQAEFFHLYIINKYTDFFFVVQFQVGIGLLQQLVTWRVFQEHTD